MRKLLFLPLFLLATLAHAAPLAFPVPSFVQTAPPAPPVVPTNDKPWYSLDNLSIAAGIGYRWMPNSDASGPKDEPIVGLYNAWQLTEHVDAIGTIKYGIDPTSSATANFEFEIGLRLILKSNP